jgi:hypothetical protein
MEINVKNKIINKLIIFLMEIVINKTNKFNKRILLQINR